ncbi:DUF192 domain-containing protein [Sulfitobacter sp.]|uniref:DUF192 domain-containing protein n=1 Tax=Sulfitobacter sp. TaxID=1903071 RepID=UPI003568FF3A
MGNRHHKRGRAGTKLSLAALFVCCGLLASAAAAADCSENAVTLRGDWGQARFSVEIADDAAERGRGLMFRESMPASTGMLFIYDKPQRASFWMRNTLIPLDMLFIDSHGVVKHIHHNAIPHDETPISGGDNLLSVLEINGGLAKRMGITVGSELRHRAFADLNPAWPC